MALTVLDIDPLVGAASWEEGGTEPWVGSHVFESKHRRKDGSIFPVEVNADYIRLDRDYIVTVVRDITERKQADAALKESEEQYRTLYEDNPSMYFTIDADGIVLSVNRFGAERLGYSIPELIGRSVLNVFYAEDKAAALQSVKKCIEHPGKVFHWILRKVSQRWQHTLGGKDSSMVYINGRLPRFVHRL